MPGATACIAWPMPSTRRGWTASCCCSRANAPPAMAAQATSISTLKAGWSGAATRLRPTTSIPACRSCIRACSNPAPAAPSRSTFSMIAPSPPDGCMALSMTATGWMSAPMTGSPPRKPCCMASAAEPGLFTIPPGRPFLDLLAAGILRQHGTDPEALARVTVLLPTRRACRALADAFLRAGDGRAMLLPKIRPLGDVDEDELVFYRSDDDATALPFAPLDRSLLLAKLLRASPLAGDDPAMTVRLARLLGDLLDSAATEEVGLERLPDLVTDAELARHWEAVLDFLKVIREHWPALKAERGRL